jgi:hypothetical protein
MKEEERLEKTTSEEQTEELQQTQIWKCTDANCKAWSRDEFVTEASPACPLCKKPMVRSYKHIPIISKKFKKTFIMGNKRK